MPRTLYQSIANLFRSKHVRIYTSNDTNSFFFWIPDDVWMLIVNEWMSHVCELLALEIAIGRRNFEHWIYPLCPALDVPCSVNELNFPLFLSWRQSRRLRVMKKISIDFKRNNEPLVPWNELHGVTHFTISYTHTNASYRNGKYLHELLQILPDLVEMSIPIDCLSLGNNYEPVQSSLKFLKLYTRYLLLRYDWKETINSLSVVVPQLESLVVEQALRYPVNELLKSVSHLTQLRVLHFTNTWSHETMVSIIDIENDYDYYDDNDDYLHRINDVYDNNDFSTPDEQLDDCIREFYPWEKVSIETKENFGPDRDHIPSLFTMLSKAPNLKELHLCGSFKIPDTFFVDNSWKFLTSIELNNVVITNDQIHYLVQCYAHQLTAFGVLDIPASTSPTDCHPARWIELLLKSALILKTLRLHSKVAIYEQEIIQQLQSCRIEPYPCLQTLQEFDVSLCAVVKLPITPKLLSPFLSLEVISLFEIDSSWHSDILEVLFEHVNNNILRVFKFHNIANFLMIPQTPDVFSKKDRYHEQCDYLSCMQKSFPRLLTLSLIGIGITDRAVQYLLCHSPQLQYISLDVLLLVRKSKLLPNVEQTLNSEQDDGLLHTKDSIYVRKEFYYYVIKYFTLQSRQTIQALINSPYLNNLSRIRTLQTDFRSNGRSAGMQPVQPHENRGFLSRLFGGMQVVTQNESQPNFNLSENEMEQRMEEEEEEQEERILQIPPIVEEVFVEYVRVNEEKQLTVKKTIAERERMETETQQRYQRQGQSNANRPPRSRFPFLLSRLPWLRNNAIENSNDNE